MTLQAIGIVGTGAMGRGIAEVTASSSLPKEFIASTQSAA